MSNGNPAPLTVRQVWAFVAVAAREVGWVLPTVAREVRAWQRLAGNIPDAPLRDDALTNLSRERLNIEGAALFAVLPRRRDHNLVRALVAYQVLLDYLDTTSERPSKDQLANGVHLHRALTDALDPSRPLSDHYRHHRWQDDGGYVRALIQACRTACLALPSYHRVRSEALRAAHITTVQAINHDPLAARRDAALAAWAAREFPESTGTSWFELTAAASSSLWLYAVLALAAEPRLSARDLVDAEKAYLPWICAASTFLDSFVDQVEDAANGSHSYVAHYPTPDIAVRRLDEIVRESAQRARGLRRGTRHALITTGMVAMYLSEDAASTPSTEAATRALLRSAGPLPKVQVPILRTLRRLRGT
jgi:tetraprenyl-beta-curcumene synthase